AISIGTSPRRELPTCVAQGGMTTDDTAPASDRDIMGAPLMPCLRRGTTGRNRLAVVGIDAYRHWTSLTNAVRDATGARTLFQQLGFEEVRPPLLDGDATGTALRALVADELR